MKDTKHTVAIVEDDSELRELLMEILSGEDEWEVAGAYPNAEAALPALLETPPELVLMDIQMPGMSGIECTAALKSAKPQIGILVLTVYEHSDRMFDALAAGASGYLLKRDVPNRLTDSMREVLEGGCPVSSSVARKLVQHFVADKPRDRSEEFDLTPREKETLELLAKGRLYKEIAGELGISQETVRYHLHNIYRKLHVGTRTEAVVKYLGR